MSIRIVVSIFPRDADGWEEIGEAITIHADDVEDACRQLRAVLAKPRRPVPTMRRQEEPRDYPVMKSFKLPPRKP